MRVLHVPVPADLMDELKRLAKKKGTFLRTYVQFALRSGIERDKSTLVRE